MSHSILEDDKPQSSEPPEPSRSLSQPIGVSIHTSDAPVRIDASPFERFASSLLHATGETDAELSISIVSDEAIHELNQQYRGIDRPTDVLSFSLREGEPIGQQYPLGDIVISLDTAKRQAESFGNQLEEEINELIFHGFLHLLGYDHDGENNGDWLSMETRTIDELKKNKAPYIPKGMKAEKDESTYNEGRTI